MASTSFSQKYLLSANFGTLGLTTPLSVTNGGSGLSAVSATLVPFGGATGLTTDSVFNYNATTHTLSVTNATVTGLTAGSLAYAGVGGALSTSANLTFSSTANLLSVPSIALMSAQTATPLAAATVTSTGTSLLALTPAGTLATLTIAWPATPADGQVFIVSSTQAITTLTVSGASFDTNMAPTTIAAGGTIRSVYIAAKLKWYTF